MQAIRRLAADLGTRASWTLPPWPLSLLSHNEFVRLDIETPLWHRHGICVFHRRRARFEDERPQLSEVLTPIVKIRKTVPTKDSLADPIPSPDKARRRLAPALTHIETGRIVMHRRDLFKAVLFEDPDGIRLEVNFVPGAGLRAEFNPGTGYV